MSYQDFRMNVMMSQPYSDDLQHYRYCKNTSRADAETWWVGPALACES